MKKMMMMMRTLVTVLLAMAWFGETHANPIVMESPRRAPRRALITVKFDANGGTVDAPSVRLWPGMSIGEEIEEEMLPMPKRDGYKFEGWYTGRTGGWRIALDSVISASEMPPFGSRGKRERQTVTVYAHWNPVVVGPKHSVTVKFDANGGTVDVSSIQLSSGMAIGNAIGADANNRKLPMPKRDGYKFVGWYTERTVGWRITSDSVISTSERDETVTVFAHWRRGLFPLTDNS